MKKLERLVLENHNLFAHKGSEFGHTCIVKRQIGTEKSKPIK